jgi:hypothetical protein
MGLDPNLDAMNRPNRPMLAALLTARLTTDRKPNSHQHPERMGIHSQLYRSRDVCQPVTVKRE